VDSFLLFFVGIMIYASVRMEGKFLEFLGAKEGHFLRGWLNLIEEGPLSS